MKKILVAAFALLFALPAHADITVGFAGPLTGSAAVFGEQMKRGVDQAVADINAKGGVKGEKLIIRPVDDACDPKQAVTVANQLASGGIKYVLGHFCSSCSIVASKVYAEEGMFMLTPGSSNPMLTEAGLPNIFRTYGRDDREGEVLGAYLIKHFKDKKIAIIQDNSAYGRGMADAVKKVLNDGGVHEIMYQAYTPGQRDYLALISRLKEAGVQVLVAGGYHTEIGLILRQLREQKSDIQVVGGNSLASNEFWAITGSAGEGMLMSFGADARKRPEAKAAAASLRKNGFEPEGYTLYAYAAVQVLAQAFEAIGKAEPVKLSEYLRAHKFETVIGPIGFDAKGDVTGVTFAVYRWHDGKYAEVGE